MRLKSGSSVRDQIHRRIFWNHPGFDVPVTIGKRLKRFQHPGQKFLAQMQRAIVLGSPDGILIQPLFRPEQFLTASLNASILPAREGSPVNFPSVLLCKKGAELQTLTSDGTR